MQIFLLIFYSYAFIGMQISLERKTVYHQLNWKNIKLHISLIKLSRSYANAFNS